MLEPMGTKRKFWYDDESLGRVLFKEVREGSGEDWSEKVASELCGIMGIPHAHYELALWNGKKGVITPTVAKNGERLVHGNELLIEMDPDYPSKSAQYRMPAHTVGAIADVLTRRKVAVPDAADLLPPALRDGLDVFIGYMMLDALIGNSDRHHENWGVLIQGPSKAGEEAETLAPTFDHASCLGRNEPEARMIARLSTRDRGFSVEAYADRCRSAIFGDVSDSRPLAPLEVFRQFREIRPEAASVWAQRAGLIQAETLRAILDNVPPGRMSAAAKELVVRMTMYNRDRLVEVFP